ncbi:hypothetical protein [Megamonas hypermegale]|uniref:hypothetical protein n=1 Tax=Megamonas hypermegale TaxID=158847 RepID=UPI003207F612
MINTKSPKFRQFLDSIHAEIESKKRRTQNDDTSYVTENRLLKLVMEKPHLGPRAWCNIMGERYGCSLDIDTVISVLRSTYPRLNTPGDRDKILPLVKEAADAFIKGLNSGKAEDYKDFRKKRNAIFNSGKSFPRLICLMIFHRCPEMNALGDGNTVENFRDALSKYIMYGLSDALADYCGDVKANTAAPQSGKRDKTNTIELQQRITHLEAALERANMMLQDLQDEFDEQLSETKIQEMTVFFAKLNSDKYGCILDLLLQVRKGINQLKKQHVALPPEISGLFILIQKMTQFVIDNHIDPIMKPGSRRMIKAGEAELCDYEGSPFMDKNEEKQIEVFSPGWVYKDKDIRISRPRIKEVTKDE